MVYGDGSDTGKYFSPRNVLLPVSLFPGMIRIHWSVMLATSAVPEDPTFAHPKNKTHQIEN
jgi:hypothetical protein